MELAEDRVQWWALVLAVLKLRVLLPDQDGSHEMCSDAYHTKGSHIEYFIT